MGTGSSQLPPATDEEEQRRGPGLALEEGRVAGDHAAGGVGPVEVPERREGLPKGGGAARWSNEAAAWDRNDNKVKMIGVLILTGKVQKISILSISGHPNHLK